MSSPGVGLRDKHGAESETSSGMRRLGREIILMRGSQQTRSLGTHSEGSRTGLRKGCWWEKGFMPWENQMRALGWDDGTVK